MGGLTLLRLGIRDHDQHTRTHGIPSTSSASDHGRHSCLGRRAAAAAGRAGKKQRGSPREIPPLTATISVQLVPFIQNMIPVQFKNN